MYIASTQASKCREYSTNSRPKYRHQIHHRDINKFEMKPTTQPHSSTNVKKSNIIVIGFIIMIHLFLHISMKNILSFVRHLHSTKTWSLSSCRIKIPPKKNTREDLGDQLLKNYIREDYSKREYDEYLISKFRELLKNYVREEVWYFMAECNLFSEMISW